MGNNKGLKPYLSPLMVTAFSIGSAIGWGSLVVTSSNYLGKAGLAGSVVGLILSMFIMLIIARNYSYLTQIYPESGGAYAFSREIFGHDYGFITAWFLILTYLSILWANATSLPLFARFFIGPVFEVGKIYTIFGYDVYLGELLLTAAGIILIALLCYLSRKAAAYAMTAMVVIFIKKFMAGLIRIITLMAERPAFFKLLLAVPNFLLTSVAISLEVTAPKSFP